MLAICLLQVPELGNFNAMGILESLKNDIKIIGRRKVFQQLIKFPLFRGRGASHSWRLLKAQSLTKVQTLRLD